MTLEGKRSYDIQLRRDCARHRDSSCVCIGQALVRLSVLLKAGYKGRLLTVHILEREYTALSRHERPNTIKLADQIDC